MPGVENIVLLPISVDDLVARIVAELKTAKPDPVNTEQETKYLSRHETAEILHCTLATLSTWTKCKKINSFKIGRRVLYRPEDVQKALRPVR